MPEKWVWEKQQPSKDKNNNYIEYFLDKNDKMDWSCKKCGNKTFSIEENEKFLYCCKCKKMMYENKMPKDFKWSERKPK